MASTSRRSWIALFLVVSVVAGALVVGGAVGQEGTETTGEDVPDQDSSFIRVAHVSPDAPPVDVYVEGERILADVPFGAVSDYAEFPADTYNVTITPAGDNETVVFEGNLTLEARSVSTLFASGEVSENATEPFQPVLLEDDAFRPGENESAVSVVHMSPDAPAGDVTANDGSVVLARNLSFQNASEYVTVPAGNHTVEIRPASPGANATPVATVNVSVEGETAYSAIAVGYLEANETAGQQPFEVTLVEDATMTVHLPGEETEEPATETETETPANVTETEATATETETEAPVTETETEAPATETAAPTPTETPTATETPADGGDGLEGDEFGD